MSEEMFKCKRAFLEPLKSHHPGSHFRAAKRLSLPPSHIPTLALPTLTAPLPRAQGHRQTLLSLQMTTFGTNIYTAPLRGRRQTQHGGATLPTLSRPPSGLEVVDTLSPDRPTHPCTGAGPASSQAGQGTLVQHRNDTSLGPLERKCWLGTAEPLRTLCLAPGNQCRDRGRGRGSHWRHIQAAQALKGRPKRALLRLPPPREGCYLCPPSLPRGSLWSAPLQGHRTHQRPISV